jgi:two-component system, sensor histidine kinase and response regulator
MNAQANADLGRVLVVDDNPGNVLLIRAQLEREGYVVDSAQTGQEGLDSALAQPPDLILLDIMMPGMDGYQVCRLLRENESTSAVPIIVLTSLSERADKLQAFKRGADDFLSKPVDRAELLARVSSLLRMRRLYEERGRLKEQLEREQAETAALETAIKTERTLRENEERFRKELEAFSYSVSHDLRAPLRAIDGFSRILLEDHAAELAPKGQKYLELVRDNARQMGRLIEDLLNFSRLSSQGVLRDQVLPARLVREALDELAFDRGERSVEVVVGDLLPCRGDAVLMKQLFVNLLSNAFKFTRQRPVAHIEIGCALTDGEVVYFVKDDGAGFDMRYADKLFGVFQRLHRAEDFEGTGVGLAIVQRIVQRHGGRVWADSALDHGATFSFTLANAQTDALESGTRHAA